MSKDLIIEDGYIIYRDENKIYREFISLDIFRDGRVLDYHHFFYKLKKLFEGMSKREDVKIYLSSTEIIHINYMIPKVDDEDLDDFIKLELKDYVSYDISKYKILYKKNNDETTISLSIDLIPLDIIESLKKIFEKIDLKFNIYPKTYLFSENGKYIYINIYSFDLIEVRDFIVNSSKKIYNNSLRELFLKNNLETYNIKNILENKYDSELINIEDDFMTIYMANFLENLKDILTFVDEDKISITGILKDTKIRDVLENKNITFDLIDEESLLKNRSINIVEKNKYNYKKILAPSLILILIFINIIYNRNLNRNLSIEKEQSTSEVKLPIDNTSNRYQVSNDKFLKTVREIENLESKKILFTNFTYDKNSIKIKGVCKSETDLKILENFEILKEEGYVENNMYKFTIYIKSKGE